MVHDKWHERKEIRMLQRFLWRDLFQLAKLDRGDFLLMSSNIK